ncbi:MAG TPA: hypothetical protein PLQ40_14400, partial [Ferruginibacter sp.]|nr:hypothetical protein [Ferruginibacter sp.]
VFNEILISGTGFEKSANPLILPIRTQGKSTLAVNIVAFYPSINLIPSRCLCLVIYVVSSTGLIADFPLKPIPRNIPVPGIFFLKPGMT